MKYSFSIKEINYGGVTVEANNPAEAKEKAEQAYYNGKVFWKDTDLTVHQSERDKSRGDAR